MTRLRYLRRLLYRLMVAVVIEAACLGFMLVAPHRNAARWVVLCVSVATAVLMIGFVVAAQLRVRRDDFEPYSITNPAGESDG